MAGRRALVALLLSLPLGVYGYVWATYPSDKTVRGAYLRIVRAVNERRPEASFAYTEEAAQHACFTIRNYRREALRLIEQDFPAEEQKRYEVEYGPFARASEGSDVFAILAVREGWMDQLRLDVSGIKSIEENGPRATVETVQGTRYAFRRRPGGIWGLTAFTPALSAEAERAARDLEFVKKAAADFRRSNAAKKSASPASAPGREVRARE